MKAIASRSEAIATNRNLSSCYSNNDETQEKKIIRPRAPEEKQIDLFLIPRDSGSVQVPLQSFDRVDTRQPEGARHETPDTTRDTPRGQTTRHDTELADHQVNWNKLTV